MEPIHIALMILAILAVVILIVVAMRPEQRRYDDGEDVDDEYERFR